MREGALIAARSLRSKRIASCCCNPHRLLSVSLLISRSAHELGIVLILLLRDQAGAVGRYLPQRGACEKAGLACAALIRSRLGRLVDSRVLARGLLCFFDPRGGVLVQGCVGS